MRLEHRHERPLSTRGFVIRLIRHGTYASFVLGGSLVLGVGGYHWIAGLAWVDALLNAAMLLGGMGPVDALPTTAGKLFATVFALYAGVIFLVLAGLLMTPVFHRVLHRYHWESDQRGR